jgi:uncharacterized phosphosugar-binding protein
MLQNAYLAKLREAIDLIETREAGKVDAAAELVAEALATGHAFYTAPLGHGNEQDLLHRAGGLMALARFDYSLSTAETIAKSLRDRPREEPFDRELETARLGLRASQLRAGDCLILGSVSGRGTKWIATAVAAKELHIHTIAITSLEYTANVTSPYPTGEKLCDVAEIVLDNCAPYGDACMVVDGLLAPAFPLSGIATTAICWMLCAQVVEKLLAQGLRPHVYRSVNREGGVEFNAGEEEEYNRLGY